MTRAVDTVWFKARMKVVGVDQGDVAGAVGRSQVVAHNIIHGVRRIDLADVAPLAGLLQVSPDQVICRAGVEWPYLSVPLDWARRQIRED